MCRSIAPEMADDRLMIRAFYVRLQLNASTANRKFLPEAITLVYRRGIQGSSLEINGSKIRTGSNSFVPLHRLRCAEPGNTQSDYASTDRVCVCSGSRFEIFVGEEQILKGSLNRYGNREWRIEFLSCTAEKDIGVTAAEIAVAGENSVALVEKVKISKRKTKKRFCLKLQEIPEETDGCGCSCCGEDEEKWEMVERDGGEEKGELEMEVEVVKWAVDLGMWAVCLGVGLFVSRASHKGLRRKMLFF